MNTQYIKLLMLGLLIPALLYAFFGRVLPIESLFAEEVYESKTAQMQTLYDIEINRLNRIKAELSDQEKVADISLCNLAKSKELDHAVGYKKYDNIDSIRAKADSCFSKYQKTEEKGLSQE